MSELTIRQAQIADVPHIISVLREAAAWLDQRGMSLWREGELLPDRITAEISADVGCGGYFIAECDSEIAGTVRFQLEDEQFWPDIPQGESAFLHRLAVRRRFAGGGVSKALLRWAVEYARGLGKKFLRLDCEASRPRLRAVYERFGFRHHSDRQVGSYFVARYEYPLVKGT